MIKVSIVGVTGYVGLELLRLLQTHPEVEIKHLLSRSQPGEKIADLYPQFAGSALAEIKLESYEDTDLTDSDLVFTALPHGVSQKEVAKIYKQGIKVIDMSGDYRYGDIDVYESWYKLKHEYPELAREAVYGLVEVNREKIKKARLVANPGCYVTASLLALIPVVEKGIINLDNIIIDAKSGVSGAGKSLKEDFLYNEVNENFKAYGVAGHRHTSEIEYVLEEFAGREVKLTFTPHLLPLKRGILATIYADLVSEIDEGEVIEMYREYYAGEAFVQILGDKLPELKYVVGTNNCQIGLKYDKRTGKLIIISVIDNLVKGAAGQAIQNMNLLFGLEETTGLNNTAFYP